MGSKKIKSEEIESVKKKPKEVKLKSEMYNHDVENIERREDSPSEAIMWGFVIGFALFFILLICIIIFTN